MEMKYRWGEHSIKQHERNSNMRFDGKKNRWFVHTAWVQQHIHFMHALNVKPYRKGNNWNRAKLQLFNLPFGYVVSLAVSLFSQLIIYFHYSPTEFILSSFLWCELVSNGFENKKRTYHVSETPLYVAAIDFVRAMLQHRNAHRRQWNKNCPKYKLSIWLMKPIKSK